MSLGFNFAGTTALINDPGTDINADESRALSLWSASYATVAATAAVNLRIKGFAPILTKTSISDVVAIRGNAGTKETLTLNAARITVAGTIPVNADIRIAINVNTLNKQAEYTRSGDFGAREIFTITVAPGDVLADVLAKIYNHIQFSDQSNLLRKLVSVDETSSTGVFGADGVASAVTVLVLNTLELGMFFDINDGFAITSAENKNLASPYVQFDNNLNTAITAGYQGRGNYSELKSIFLEDETVAYHFHRYERPIPGSLYTSFSFSYTDTGEGGTGPNEQTTSKSRYTIYVNESTCATTINALIDVLGTAATINAPAIYGTAATPAVVTVAAFKLP